LKRFAFLFAVVCLSTLAVSQTFSCPSGTEDMMNYFVMSYPNRVDNFMGPGNANPIYTSITPEMQTGFATQGYFLWIKSVAGYPWDIKSFDSKYIYDRTTELSWTDPTSFKRFTKDLPMSPRCVSTRYTPPAIKLPPASTGYQFYASCQSYKPGQLNYVLNTISNATMASTSGNLGLVKTRYFRYRYNCNSSYGNCTDMEMFSLGYGVGLYDWKHYVNKNGTWTLVQDSTINNFKPGQTTPSLPCTTSYQ